MIKFIKNIFHKNEGRKKYYEKLKSILDKKEILESDEKDLKSLEREYELNEKEVFSIKKEIASLLFNNICSDNKITDEEKSFLQKICEFLGLELKDFNFNQEKFNEYYTVGLLENNILPTIKEHDLNIIFKKDEILHWTCNAQLRKNKRVTDRINYGGIGGSIKIIKGVRYRYGSMKFKTNSHDELQEEDIGRLWITNKRIGFIGKRKNFVFNIEKIHSIELTQNGLEIVKEGKETPYIIGLNNYDIPCLVVSNILNN